MLNFFLGNKRGHWIKRTLICLIGLKIRSWMPSDLNAIMRKGLKMTQRTVCSLHFLSHCWVLNNTIKLETILWWDQGRWEFYLSPLQYNHQRPPPRHIILKVRGPKVITALSRPVFWDMWPAVHVPTCDLLVVNAPLLREFSAPVF